MDQRHEYFQGNRFEGMFSGWQGMGLGLREEPGCLIGFYLAHHDVLFGTTEKHRMADLLEILQGERFSLAQPTKHGGRFPHDCFPVLWGVSIGEGPGKGRNLAFDHLGLEHFLFPGGGFRGPVQFGGQGDEPVYPMRKMMCQVQGHIAAHTVTENMGFFDSV